MNFSATSSSSVPNEVVVVETVQEDMDDGVNIRSSQERDPRSNDFHVRDAITRGIDEQTTTYDDDDGLASFFSSTTPPMPTRHPNNNKSQLHAGSRSSFNNNHPMQKADVYQGMGLPINEKVVDLKNFSRDDAIWKQRQTNLFLPGDDSRLLGKEKTVEEIEDEARDGAMANPYKILYFSNLAAFKVMGVYLITLETIISTIFTVGLTLYWYFAYEGDVTWTGTGLNFILLAFTITSAVTTALGMAFTRRERALINIAEFRSFSHHLLLAHLLWDWKDNGGRAGANVDWVEHCDAVMAQLIAIGDELARFLTLPSTSRSRNRMTNSGRMEAQKTSEAAHYLTESMGTQRMTRLILYSERLMKLGLEIGEVARIQ
jgi:hypothetical protein